MISFAIAGTTNVGIFPPFVMCFGLDGLLEGLTRVSGLGTLEYWPWTIGVMTVAGVITAIYQKLDMSEG